MRLCCLLRKILINLRSSIISHMKDLNRIKVVLAERKVTGRWLAKQLGKSTCTVSKWCTNSAQPDLQTLNQIASVLEVNIKDLLTDSKE